MHARRVPSPALKNIDATFDPTDPMIQFRNKAYPIHTTAVTLKKQRSSLQYLMSLNA